MEALVDIRADVTMISSKSWHADWPLQEVNIQLLGTGTLPQAKASARWEQGQKDKSVN